MKNNIRKYIFGLTTMLALSGLTASAQSFVADNATVNLGQVKYFNPTKATFTLKNAASKPVSIKDIDTGCGCIRATYPQGVIDPGQTFKIDVVYDAKLMGHFQRNIFVFDDASETPTELILKGNVVMEVENFSGEYPITLGALLADVNEVEFDDVKKGDRMINEIHIMNPTGQYVEPSVMRLPSYLRAEFVPHRLAPKGNGIMRLILDSHKLYSYGLTQTTIYLASTPSEKISEDKSIDVSVVLLPEAIKLDEAARQFTPHLQLSTTEVDMTSFNNKSKKKAEILLTNTGRITLEISSLQMFTTGLEVTLSKRKLAPGESTKLKITGIADKLKNLRTRPRILMITNDPSNPKVVIEIKK